MLSREERKAIAKQAHRNRVRRKARGDMIVAVPRGLSRSQIKESVDAYSTLWPTMFHLSRAILEDNLVDPKTGKRVRVPIAVRQREMDSLRDRLGMPVQHDYKIDDQRAPTPVVFKLQNFTKPGAEPANDSSAGHKDVPSAQANGSTH